MELFKIVADLIEQKGLMETIWIAPDCFCHHSLTSCETLRTPAHFSWPEEDY